MSKDTLMLTIAGERYEMKPEEEEIIRRKLTYKYKPFQMVMIHDKETGTFYETIRLDELFNF